MASEKVAQLIEEVKVLSVLELSELVHALEEEFGVEIPSEDLEHVTTVGDVINYLKEHNVTE